MILCAVFSLFLHLASSTGTTYGPSDAASSACSLLAAAIPDGIGLVGSEQYTQDNAHWMGSSSQPSRCTVQPATQADVAVIFNIINQTRTQWAVKSGGHAYNPGYSSTPGVLISLTRFNDTTYDAATSTAHVGAGLLWDDVYAALDPYGVTVVGARGPGIGVAGLSLGGGYGWKSQQHGLTIDTIAGFELVTPTGAILHVTETSNPDLFFGLRGGGNNFGIVTGFTLKTYPQTEVYGGAIRFLGLSPAVTDAVVHFDANNRDPKAAILASYTFVNSTIEVVVFLFYDAPTAPEGTFDEFLRIPNVLNTVRRQSFPDFIRALDFDDIPVKRAGAHTVSIIQYTRPIVEEIVNQTIALGRQAVATGPGGFAALTIEPFFHNIYDHSTGGAYPHTPAHPWTPLEVLAVWDDAAQDAALRASVLQSTECIHQVAIRAGQSSAGAILYNNYAMKGTPLERLYGDYLPRLRELRARYDPWDLMSLTGGWRF